MEKLTNRQIQNLKTRQNIVDSANRCFIRQGMNQTLITDICKEAQVSVGTFYHHFKNKEDLIISQFKIFDMGFLKVAKELIEDENAMQSLVRFSRFFSRDALNSDNILSIEYLKARVALTMEQLLPKNRPYFIILCTVIHNGQKRKQIRNDLSPITISSLIMTVTRGYNLDWASTDGAYSLKERLDLEIPILFSSLAWKKEDSCVWQGEDLMPTQNVPTLYRDEVAQLREYCLSQLL